MSENESALGMFCRAWGATPETWIFYLESGGQPGRLSQWLTDKARMFTLGWPGTEQEVWDRFHKESGTAFFDFLRQQADDQAKRADLYKSDPAKLTVEEYLLLANLETARWLRQRQAEGSLFSWAGMLAENPAHWSECKNGYDVALRLAAATYSDVYKDAHGVRPRHDTSDWDLDRYTRETELVSQLGF